MTLIFFFERVWWCHNCFIAADFLVLLQIFFCGEVFKNINCLLQQSYFVSAKHSVFLTVSNCTLNFHTSGNADTFFQHNCLKSTHLSYMSIFIQQISTFRFLNWNTCPLLLIVPKVQLQKPKSEAPVIATGSYVCNKRSWWSAFSLCFWKPLFFQFAILHFFAVLDLWKMKLQWQK